MNKHYLYGRNRVLEDSFICKHCHAFVSTAALLSGVHNRNHCPYCLWSRHLDLYAAGDRLCACKGKMQPIGLTIKRIHKKYPTGSGELMIIHQCTECDRLSINRIAADDDSQTLWELFSSSLRLAGSLKASLAENGIQPLREADQEVVRSQLYIGQAASSAPVK